MVQFICKSQPNTTILNLPISYTSINYVALCNIITTSNQGAYDGQINVKQKTISFVEFPALTSAKRQLLTFGY